jgi:REP element-mobilizing transposase RayT
MTSDPSEHRRRSIRLQGYDYSWDGAYFVTVCAQNRVCLFGDVVDGEMRLNDAGKIVRNEWLRTGDIRSNVELDVFVVMPNHFHAIVCLSNEPRRGDRLVAPTIRDTVAPTMTGPTGPTPGSIGAILAGFKSITTKRINEMRNTPSAPVWQRNYYEHIIRDGESLNKIREYIVNNPMQWAFDRENLNIVRAGLKPARTKDEPWRI